VGFGSLPFLPTDMITSSDLGFSYTTGYGKLRLQTAPSATAVSLAEAKTHLRIDSTFTTDDTYITTLIDVATAAAENYMGLKIMAQSWFLDIDAFPSYFDLLIASPKADATINAITYFDANNASQTLAASNYFVDSTRKPVRIYESPDGNFPSTYERPNAVTVDFALGYSTAGDVPAPIRQAILLMIGSYYETRQTVSDRTYKEIPQTAEYLLQPYRIQR
tara:strand:+ start:162 stop:821 length:660 start_codon:yes stop_codon:yes gene_type:complete